MPGAGRSSGAEFQLLLLCARTDPNLEAVANLLKPDLDWSRLLFLAAHHGVMPLVRETLVATSWGSAPPEFKLQLTAEYKANLVRNLSLSSELLRLQAALQNRGIRAATFKGPVLAEEIYGDVSRREFCDVDLLVAQEDVAAAEGVLKSCGYGACFADSAYRSAFLSYHGQYMFKDDKGHFVDLHWELATRGERFPLSTAGIWPTLRAGTVCGRQVLTLSHDDLALLLAGHGSKEGWRALKWLCDYAELVRRAMPVDWASVYERATSAGCERALLTASWLAVTLLDAPCPAWLLEKARRSSSVLSLAAAARVRLESDEPAGEVALFIGGMNARERLGDKLRSAARIFLTRTVSDHDALPLPQQWWWVYHLTRPFRLTWKGVLLLLRGGT